MTDLHQGCSERRRYGLTVPAAGIVVALSAFIGAIASHADSESAYPSKTVRLVVPFSPGSATDAVGRILADELSQQLGGNVIVENRAGAFGQIAATYVARSAPDGYTLLMTTNTTHSANPHLFSQLPYDPLKDFDAIVRTGTLPFMLVITPSLPVRSTAELIAHARANPGKLSFGTANSTSLVGGETINTLGKVSIVRVQYKASPQSILDLMAGRLHLMVADFATAMPQVRAGNLKVLGVTTAKRSALLPDVPPIADTLKGYDLTSWNGLFAPAGTPDNVISRLEKETLAILARPEIGQRLATLGFEVDPMKTAEFSRYVRSQIAYWGRLIRDAGIKPE